MVFAGLSCIVRFRFTVLSSGTIGVPGNQTAGSNFVEVRDVFCEGGGIVKTEDAAKIAVIRAALLWARLTEKTALSPGPLNLEHWAALDKANAELLEACKTLERVQKAS